MQSELKYEPSDNMRLRAHVKILVAKLEIRDANLPEKISIMRAWFNSCHDESKLVNRTALAKFFIRLGLVKEIDTAQKLVENRLKNITSDKLVEWIDFARCFMRSVFCESLVTKLH